MDEEALEAEEAEAQEGGEELEDELPAQEDAAAAEEGEAAEEEPSKDGVEEEAAADVAADDAGLEEEEPQAGEPEDEEDRPALERSSKPSVPLLERGRDGKYVVRMRRKLMNEKSAQEFCDQLQTKVDEEKVAGQTLVFEDFDISQNMLPGEQLESIFAALADGGVHVERFRAFGVPTLDDTAVTFLAGWLSGVSQDTAPFELHLSDCAITSDGFYDLARALEENDAFPPLDPKSPARGQLPLYVRLENNYIEDAAIQKAVDDGVVVPMRRSDGVRYSKQHKCRLLVRDNGSFQQKRGPPPAPQDAPPPKPVHDKGSLREKGRGKARPVPTRREEAPFRRPRAASRERHRGGRDRDRERERDRGKGCGKIGGTQQKPPWAALPAPRPSTGKGDRRRLEVERPAPLKRYDSAGTGPSYRSASAGPSKSSGGGYSRSGPYNAFSGGGGSSGGSKAPPYKRSVDSWDRDEGAKRHRPSSGKGTGAPSPRPTDSRGGVQGNRSGGSLPYPWEEHWSDEYSLTYYWNSKTGKSLWERPRV